MLKVKFTAKGENFDALIRAKMQQLDLTYDEAYEEVVADSCESFLIDSNLIENVEELSKRDMNLATKIKDFLKNLLQKVREVYKKLSPDSYEGKYVREMRDSLSELHGKWVQSIKNATENLNNAKTSATKNTANNDGVKYSLTRYTEHQIKNWSISKNIVVYESEQQLRQFIDDARNGKNLSKKMYFGSIPESLANRIKKDTGVDVKNYNCTLRASEIRKIFADHGDEVKENLRGQRAIVEDDFLSIPEVIQNPEKIKLSDTLYEGKPIIEFSKTINGITTVKAYVSKKHLDLTVQTMYSGKNKRNLATAAGVQAPANTPEAHVGTVPNNIIFNSDEKINQNSENIYLMKYHAVISSR